MSKSRRQFITQTSLGILGAAAALRSEAQNPADLPPGAPPAFGTAPQVGPMVSTTTFTEAQKLVQIEMTPADLKVAADSWRATMAALYERRTGPRKAELESSVQPATQWNPALPGLHVGPKVDRFARSQKDPGPLPAKDEDIAFAPVSKLSRWVEQHKLTSTRLTKIYLDRIERFDPKLRCVITLTRDLALSRAQKADEEIAAGHYRGPLHGLPFGVKDLLDTADIATTWGAEPFRNRIPTKDATVVQRLHEAGAVLIAKLSLGALALNDVWFGGQTMNPWLLEEVYPSAKDIFAAYAPPAVSEDTVIVALDTNALLLPYRMNPGNLEAPGKVYKELSDKKRLVVPARAVREFAKHRDKKLGELIQALNEQRKRFPSDQLPPLVQDVDGYKEAGQCLANLKKIKEAYDKAVGKNGASGMWIVRRGSGRWAEFCGHYEHVMRF